MADRYLLFCTNQYYPAGGWGDYFGNFKSIDEAKKHASVTKNREDYEIVDLETLEVVDSGLLYDLRKK